MVKRLSIILVAALIATLVVYFSSKLGQVNHSATAPVMENTNSTPSKLSSLSKPVTQFSMKERDELDKLYNERLLPAIERWRSVYRGRLPDEMSRMGLTNFHSTLAGGFYTFVNGDITLTVSDTKKGTRVFYMMSKETALTLNTVGKLGQPPDLSLPVNREQIIQLVKADTGVEYRIHQVEIKPTAAACDLQGGAFVEVGKQMLGDMELMTGTNVSFVFTSNGKIAAYQH